MKFAEAFHKCIRPWRKKVAVTSLCLLFVCLSICATAQSIGNLLNQAQKRIEAGEFENALTLVEKALKEQPLDASALLLQGLAFSGLEKWEQAYGSFTKAWSQNRSLLLAKRNQGISAFHLKKLAEAKAAVGACRYPPDGLRSMGPIRSREVDPGWRQPLCVAMIETVEAVGRADEILAVPGIDAVFVGPNDLAVSAGLDSSYEGKHPEHRQSRSISRSLGRDHVRIA